MDVVHPCCAGLDVHKKTVVACVLRSAAVGTASQTRSFSTLLPGLEQLRDWLREQGVTHVAMEATGVYWKPVVNVLEAHVTVLVANPEHIKAIPRRKTDPKDAAWIAQLLRYGLVRASFIPDREQRDLRELTRYRTAKLQDRAREVNRLQKTLEGANIKLASVLTDSAGVSGQRILDAVVHGETDPEALVVLADPRVQRHKGELLLQALQGQLSAVLLVVVREQLQQIQALDEQIARCDAAVAEALAPVEDLVQRLDAIPGVGRRTAETLLAELGTDLSRWPSAAHLAAWAGVAPGNKQSGGKRYAARTRKGNPWVKRALTEAGWAAGRSTKSYLGQQYRRLAARKGRKRAVVALAHQILIIVYHMLTEGTEYCDLGLGYWETRYAARREQRAVQLLKGLGYEVTEPPRPAAA